MALSKAKAERVAKKKRQAEINARSLNGSGYFMDANWDAAARAYVETGNERYLAHIPDRKK